MHKKTANKNNQKEQTRIKYVTSWEPMRQIHANRQHRRNTILYHPIL